MKYNTTFNLNDILNNVTPEKPYDLPNGRNIRNSDYSNIQSEYYPPGIIIEACQTIADENTIPTSQSQVKYVLSKRFRPYSLPTPNLVATTNVASYYYINVKNNKTLTLNNLEIQKAVKAISKITSTFADIGNAKVVSASISSISADSFSASEITSNIGIITDLHANTIDYTNAQISNLNVNSDISLQKLTVDSILDVTNNINIERNFNIKYHYSSDIWTPTEIKTEPSTDANAFEISTTLFLDSPVISEMYLYKRVPHQEIKVGRIAMFSGEGEISADRDLSVSLSDVSSDLPIGVFTDPSKTFTQGFINHDPYDYTYISGHYDEEHPEQSEAATIRKTLARTIAPVAPFGRIKMVPANISNPDNKLKKFDRLELSDTGAKVRKHNFTSTRRIIGIALEDGEYEEVIDDLVKPFHATKQIECIMSFNLY